MIVTKACPECDGYGFKSAITDNSIASIQCKRCNGTGSVNVCATHKELIQNADTEELSKWLNKAIRSACPPGRYCVEEADYSCIDCWREWLEQTGNPEDTLSTTIDHR